jgi:hypothetical protein
MPEHPPKDTEYQSRAFELPKPEELKLRAPSTDTTKELEHNAPLSFFKVRTPEEFIDLLQKEKINDTTIEVVRQALDEGQKMIHAHIRSGEALTEDAISALTESVPSDRDVRQGLISLLMKEYQQAKMIGDIKNFEPTRETSPSEAGESDPRFEVVADNQIVTDVDRERGKEAVKKLHDTTHTPYQAASPAKHHRMPNVWQRFLKLFR